ncbi:MAG: cytochrome b N-terminal domain-containing protein [Chloroflexi bacterium]|nr:cytochrome b N-terminal domain-containing protein [Chloroflexota bacterium]
MSRIWRKEKSLIYALHPETIPASGVRFTYTFGLGGITIFAALVTLLTGLALTFYYVPTPEGAHDSIVLINDVVSFGAMMRGLHYWAAQLMVLAATLHLARVVFTGGYRPPRELNWLIGLGLLVVTLLWDFTGYVLRWDDGAYWALLVGTNLVREIPFWGEALYRALVGDAQIGASALLRFYGWHIFGLTVAGVFGMVYHLWRLKKDGGISRPVLEHAQVREFVSKDELFFREFIAAALVSAALILLTVLIQIPIGPAATLDAIADVRAPWIFLWVQNPLRDLPPLWAGILAPLGVLVALALIPFLDRRGPGRAIWFARERWKPQVLLAALALGIIVLSLREVLR